MTKSDREKKLEMVGLFLFIGVIVFGMISLFYYLDNQQKQKLSENDDLRIKELNKIDSEVTLFELVKGTSGTERYNIVFGYCLEDKWETLCENDEISELETTDYGFNICGYGLLNENSKEDFYFHTEMCNTLALRELAVVDNGTEVYYKTGANTITEEEYFARFEN